MSDDSSLSYQAQWLLAEYQELRKETERRSKEKFLCITASVAALGSLLSFVATDRDSYYPLLLLIPWLQAVFAFKWISDDYYTRLIGGYVETTAERWINETTSPSFEIGWERYLRRLRNDAATAKDYVSTSGLVFWLYFMIPAALCVVLFLVITYSRANSLPPLAALGSLADAVVLGFLGNHWRRVKRHRLTVPSSVPLERDSGESMALAGKDVSGEPGGSSRQAPPAR